VHFVVACWSPRWAVSSKFGFGNAPSQQSLDDNFLKLGQKSKEGKSGISIVLSDNRDRVDELVK
jgi:hypothetical protein